MKTFREKLKDVSILEKYQNHDENDPKKKLVSIFKLSEEALKVNMKDLTSAQNHGNFTGRVNDESYQYLMDVFYDIDVTKNDRSGDEQA